MSKEDNGVPAFPQHPDCLAEKEEGMKLRDYFAAKAMQAYLSSAILASRNSDGEVVLDMPSHKSASKQAYNYADAMLEARIK